VSRIHTKLKFRKGNYLLGSYEAGCLHEENMRGTFREQLNIEPKSLKCDDAKIEWNNFRKILCEVADGVLV